MVIMKQTLFLHFILPFLQKSFQTRALPQSFEIQEDALNGRSRFLHDFCKSTCVGQDKDRAKRRMIVDEKHSMAYCSVPKVGCSTMKRIFWVLNGKSESKDPQKIQLDIHEEAMNIQLTYNHTIDANNVMDTYFKFLVVRNPIERMWSAFLDTVYIRNFLHVLRGPIEDFSAKDRTKSLQCEDDYTFFDLLWTTVTLHYLNDHVAPYSLLCQPCGVKYDAIVRLETLYTDLTHIFKKRGALKDIVLSGYHTKSSSTHDVALRIITKAMSGSMVPNLNKTYTINGVTQMCGNSSTLANRLWKSFIWRGYVPSGAPYPHLLHSGENIV